MSLPGKVMFASTRRLWLALIFILYFSVAWSWTFLQQKSPLSTPQNLNPDSHGQGSGEQHQHPRLSFRRQELQLYTLGPRNENSKFTSKRSSSSLLFSEHQTSDWILSDSELIESIICAKTTGEVDQTLRQAFISGRNATSSSHGQQKRQLQQHVSLQESASVVDSNKLPLAQLSLNVSSAVLRRMAYVSVLEARVNTTRRRDNDNSTIICSDDSKLREEIVSDLLRNLGVRLVAAHQSPERQKNEDNKLSAYALSDILQALAILPPTSSTREKMTRLSEIVIDLLDDTESEELFSVGPIRLVQCLQAMAKLEISHSSLRQRIYQRLLKPDAVSKLPARFLAHALSTLAAIQKNEHRDRNKLPLQTEKQSLAGNHNNYKSNHNDGEVRILSRAFMRRLRKQKVAGEATIEDLIRAVVATSDLLKLGIMTEMEDEAAIFGFSGLRKILDLHIAARDEQNASSLLTAAQVGDLISSWAMLADRTREDTVIEQLLLVCVEDEILQGSSLTQLVFLFHAVQKLDMTKHAEFTTAVGTHVLELIVESQSSGFVEVDPKSISEILRWPILAHRRNKEVMRPYVDASSILFLQDSFLARCTSGEIANFLWFLSSAHTYNEDVLQKIGLRLMASDMVDGCSPKMASRILATFTSLVASEKNSPSDSLIQIKQDLFHSYGGHLLSSSLSPAEISSSLYAYAKANYLQDMGVFDHLVNLLASLRHECTTRQLSQSLWSCGKIIAWERQELEQDGLTFKEHIDPPYIAGAKMLTEELSCRAEALSPADVAQVIWALGRLDLREEELMSTFVHRSIGHASKFSSSQISNILWGMAQTQHRDTGVIKVLVDRLTSQDGFTSPKEAGSVLFSLGKLDWCDEVVFEHLSHTIIDQIDAANAQCIANSLWAYKTVRLAPPQRLLDTWASEKLGLQSVNTYS